MITKIKTLKKRKCKKFSMKSKDLLLSQKYAIGAEIPAPGHPVPPSTPDLWSMLTQEEAEQAAFDARVKAIRGE